MDNRRDSTNSCLVSSYSDSYNNSYNNSYIDKCFLKKRNSYNSRKSVLKTNTMIVLWFLILVGILNSVIVFSSAYSIPDSQYDALQDLYNSCDGDNWRWYRNNHSIPWDFTDNSDPCIDNWEGVGCACAVTSTIVCTVVELELIRHRLRGDIPSSISDLSTLVLLDLSANEIEESIPSSITTIETLQALFLLSNEITGKLPSDILSMPKLRVLDVSGNLIAGSIPSEIGRSIFFRCFCIVSSQYFVLALIYMTYSSDIL